MKKIFLSIFLFCLLSIIFIPFLAQAWSIGDQIVPNTCGIGNLPNNIADCPGDTGCPCGIAEFFTMLSNIYSFIVLEIASPLAVIAIAIGGILMLISAGNPGMFSLGKNILYAAIIGLVLAFGSYLIIDSIVTILGYTGTWSST